MTLDQSQHEVAEANAFSHAKFWSDQVTELSYGLSAMYKLRNKPQPDMAPDTLAQRRFLIDVVIKITKAEFKRAVRQLIEAQEGWEKFE